MFWLSPTGHQRRLWQTEKMREREWKLKIDFCLLVPSPKELCKGLWPLGKGGENLTLLGRACDRLGDSLTGSAQDKSSQNYP